MPGSATAFVDPRCEWILRHTLLPFVRWMWRPERVDTGAFPQGPCFVYGNHSNNFDPFILNCFTPVGRPTAGVMTLERLRKGPLAYLFRGVGLLPTRKHVPEPHLIRRIYRLLDAGRAVVIYPEGGRRWDGRPKPWIEATAKLFVKGGVPVYPVRTHGSYAGWPRWARFPRPARITVECLPSLHFDRHTPLREALARLQAPIAIDENDVPAACRPRRAFRPADGIHRLLYRDPDTGANDGVYTPDGTRVVNRAGTRRWTMQPDSTLRDDITGATVTTGDLYEAVRHLPLETDHDGALVQNRTTLHVEDDPPTLTARGSVRALLFDDAVRLQRAGFQRTIGLDAIRYVDIERNYKLQLTTDDGMLQLGFTRDGSALQWADTIQRLRNDKAETRL